MEYLNKAAKFVRGLSVQTFYIVVFVLSILALFTGVKLFTIGVVIFAGFVASLDYWYKPDIDYADFTVVKDDDK